MYQEKKVSGILLAAGQGNRMKLNANKVYHTLPAQSFPVLYYPLAAYEKNEYIDEILLVVRAEDEALLQDLKIPEQFPQKPIRMVIGGKNRYDSVYQGLLKASGEIVVIHDGARPLLKQRFISDCVAAMAQYDGAIVGIKSIDRLCLTDEAGFVVKDAGGGDIYRVQTPQCFHTNILKACHEKITDKTTVSDDSSLLERCGYRVKMLPGDETNIKITVPTDLIMAEHYLLNDAEILNLLA